MNDNMQSNKQGKGKYNGDMMPYSIRLPASLLEDAKARAGMIPLARVFRRLIELWVAGKIQLEDFED